MPAEAVEAELRREKKSELFVEMKQQIYTQSKDTSCAVIMLPTAVCSLTDSYNINNTIHLAKDVNMLCSRIKLQLPYLHIYITLSWGKNRKVAKKNSRNGFYVNFKDFKVILQNFKI